MKEEVQHDHGRIMPKLGDMKPLMHIVGNVLEYFTHFVFFVACRTKRHVEQEPQKQNQQM